MKLNIARGFWLKFGPQGTYEDLSAPLINWPSQVAFFEEAEGCIRLGDETRNRDTNLAHDSRGLLVRISMKQ
jgi:hypothetical protein